MLFEKKFTLLLLFVAFNAAQASYLREVSVKTANCTQCGMTYLGQLSAKVTIGSLGIRVVFFKFKFYQMYSIVLLANYVNN